jgi:hypothetical protein
LGCSCFPLLAGTHRLLLSIIIAPCHNEIILNSYFGFCMYILFVCLLMNDLSILHKCRFYFQKLYLNGILKNYHIF